ncbi:hypothetical protein EU556_04740 [Hymenobacter fodinae]|uniref:Uncharacterized protein n=1 Tax=Hymenobacter fodinae TaxID=2510796 RepID=A0A4Z0PBY5_9BACT|nr:hypothetical protein EU556_04740 [Hymenobacter fodinae]
MPIVLVLLALVGVGEDIVLGVLFLSLFPLAVTGLVYTVKALRLASKSNDYEKKDVGYANLVLGLILAGFGLLALGFAYMMTSR